MCGFSGFYNPKASYLESFEQYQSILTNMTRVLFHRGPDGNGTYLKQHCGLSHTRLSIIDLEKGAQPFIVDDYAIVYNGELYNTEELRNVLKASGERFDTHSDTEVILRGLIKEGPDFINKLNGIFAFAFYNYYEDTLMIARDSFGVKPLFYYHDNDTFVFSSEIKGLLAYPTIKPVLKKEGLQELFGLGPARRNYFGIFDGVKECIPGHYLLLNRQGMIDKEYFRLESKHHTDDYKTTVDKTRQLLISAIRRQMVSDVPICTFLSGGIDSSVVSAVCADNLPRLTTFSFDFVDNDIYFQSNSFQPSQDRPYVDKMVSYLDSDHHYLFCDNQKMADLLYDSVRAHDLPCMADVDSSLLYFCSEVSRTHKVVLTGECADEIFGGYPWFHRAEFFKPHQFPWTPDLTPRLLVLDPELRNKLSLEEYVAEACRESVNEINLLEDESPVEKQRRQISYLNIRYFMQTLLNRMDRTSMHSGLEARVPFCDRELLCYVFNVPWEMKAKDGTVKSLLRQASKGLLPDEILFRKKSPYPKTYHPAYENILKERLKDCLHDASSPLNDLVDKQYLFTFLDEKKDYSKPWYGQLMAGPQMLAYLLQINFWLKEYNITISLN